MHFPARSPEPPLYRGPYLFSLPFSTLTSCQKLKLVPTFVISCEDNLPLVLVNGKAGIHQIKHRWPLVVSRNEVLRTVNLPQPEVIDSPYSYHFVLVRRQIREKLAHGYEPQICVTRRV